MDYFNSVRCFDPVRKFWTEAAPMNCRRWVNLFMVPVAARGGGGALISNFCFSIPKFHIAFVRFGGGEGDRVVDLLSSNFCPWVRKSKMRKSQFPLLGGGGGGRGGLSGLLTYFITLVPELQNQKCHCPVGGVHLLSNFWSCVNKWQNLKFPLTGLGEGGGVVDPLSNFCSLVQKGQNSKVLYVGGGIWGKKGIANAWGPFWVPVWGASFMNRLKLNKNTVISVLHENRLSPNPCCNLFCTQNCICWWKHFVSLVLSDKRATLHWNGFQPLEPWCQIIALLCDVALHLCPKM